MIRLNDELENLRLKIDEIDRSLAELIGHRAKVALEIGKAKGTAPVYDPTREREVIRRFQEANGDLDQEALAGIHKEIISLCRSLQRRPVVACMGPEGSYSQQAMEKALGSSVDGLFVSGPREVFRAVETGKATMGIVPVENTVEGVVYGTLDGFAQTSPNMAILQEVALPIRHVLAASCDMDEIEQVVSHPQALAQCRLWLEEHLPGVAKNPVVTTSHGAYMAKERGTAAVCSAKAAEINGLRILAQDIQDQPHNTTRFWVVGENMSKRPGGDKSSILFSVPHRPGSLLDALDPLRSCGVNLTAIQSRPMPGNPFEYLFFLDMEGDIESLSQAIEEMGKKCLRIRVLGSYPSNLSVPFGG